FPDHHHLFGSLEEINRSHRIEQEARNTDRPASLLGRPQHRLGQSPLIELSQFLSHPRLQNWIAQVGDAVRRLLSQLSRRAIVDKGMRPVERDRTRSRWRLTKIITHTPLALHPPLSPPYTSPPP